MNSSLGRLESIGILKHICKISNGCQMHDVEQQLKYSSNFALIYRHVVATKPNKQFLGTRQVINNQVQYVWKTYEEVFVLSQNLAFGILKQSLAQPNSEGKQFLGIFSPNRDQWVITLLASVLVDICIVPIFANISEVHFQEILEQTELETVVCGYWQVEALIEAKNKNPKLKLKNVVCFDQVEQHKYQTDIKLINYQELIALGEVSKEQVQYSSPTSESWYMICYTSGTEDKTKGAIITHKNVVSSVYAVNKTDVYLNNNEVHLSFLPLVHVYEQAVLVNFMYRGGKIAFYDGDPEQLVNEWSIVQPTKIFAVPKVFQQIVLNIQQRMRQQGSYKRSFLETALRVKLQNLRTTGSIKHKVWDFIFFNQIKKKVIGERATMLFTGAAPLNQQMQEFLQIVLCTPIQEVYGLTECFAIGCYRSESQGNFIHVGGPFATTEFKLIDIPEMGYLTNSKDLPRGEILIRGPCVFQGYYKDIELTKQVLDSEGWLHTGDVGQVLKCQALQIVDRKKHIFKLSHGEYIYPERIENIIIENCQYVKQCFIYGEPTQQSLVAIIVLQLEKMAKYYQKKAPINQRLSYSNLSMKVNCQDQEIKQFVLSQIKIITNYIKILDYEIPKAIYLESEPFSVSNCLLTPTYKLRRYVIIRKYKSIFNKLYQELE